MDPFSNLPFEILQLILQNLSHEKHYGTLAALLQTNKYIAAATLPFLYCNPYQRAKHGKLSNNTYDFTVRSDHFLTRMLLSQLSLSTLPPIVSFVLLESDNTHSLSTSSILDYFAQIRHFLLPTWALDLDYYWPDECYRKKADNKINGQVFDDMCKIHNLLPLYDDNMGTEEERRRFHYQATFWREACWTLTNPMFEQLLSLTISVLDLDRYSRSMARLGNLEHVHFHLDVIVDYSEQAYYGGSESTMSPEFESMNQERKVKFLQSMVQFVQNHTRLFPGRLKTVTSSDCGMWPDLCQKCPLETELEMLRILPPLIAPKILSKDNFLHLSAHSQSTDLTQVQEIIDLDILSPWYNFHRDGREFLQRCRSLRKIHMESLGPGTFTWAVQEKLDSLSLGHNTNEFSETGVLLPTADQPAFMRTGLVPLKEFSILESDEALSDEIDNIAFAFSHTLEKIEVMATIPGQTHTPRILSIGHGWVDLPKLTTLYITASWSRLVLDMAMLSHCPNLNLVSLTDSITLYRCQDIVTYLPANLSRLDTLQLIGWSALSFHPSTLHSTKALTKLSISMGQYEFDGCYIPPVEELNASFQMESEDVESATSFSSGRPRWTWDWHLPLLTSLTLTAEFAYLFQFRMLQKCPLLQFLTLSTRWSNESIHASRLITEDDLFMPETDITNKTSREPIVSPVLEGLRLIGPWEIDDSLLHQFFFIMFPRLNGMDAVCVKGYTLGKLVSLLKAIPNNLAEISLRFSPDEPTKDEARKIGMLPENDIDKERLDLLMKEGRLVNVDMDWSRFYVIKPSES